MRKLAEGEDGVLVELGVHLRSGLVAAHAALLQAFHILRNILRSVLYRLRMHGPYSQTAHLLGRDLLHALLTGGALCLTSVGHLSVACQLRVEGCHPEASTSEFWPGFTEVLYMGVGAPSSEDALRLHDASQVLDSPARIGAS